MSGTDPDSDLPDHEADELAAAEFVLAALPSAELAILARRVETDAGFAALVARWEERLAPMAAEILPQAAAAKVKKALDLRLFGQAPMARSGFWANLALWRGLAALTTAAFLLVLTLPMLRPPTPAERLAASLTVEGSGVTYLVLYDAARGNVSLAHMTGAPVEGHDFELWVARGSEPPVSLGVIPAGVSTEVAVTNVTRSLMTNAAHMAISLEPPGGSPTGQPTGAVLAVGDLLDI